MLYVDLLVIEDLILNYCILIGTSLLLNRRTSLPKLFFSSVTGTIDITYNNENLTINLSNNSQYGNNLISKPNVANAKNYEQLTEDETKVIMFNAYSKLGAFDLFKDLSSIIGNIDNDQVDNDDDYNFDDLNDYDFDDTEF